MDDYVRGKKASEILNVHIRTLYQWEQKGKIETIRTPGNHRLYNVTKFLKYYNNENKNDENQSDENSQTEERLHIAYIRVSSLGQKDDLERQRNYISKRFPNHTIIEDIGSGMNLNKRGIKKIIHLAIEGKIEEVVVVHKDKLCRFGFELIEELINKYSNGKIIIINKDEKEEPETELVKDVLQIMNIFVAKMNGLRKYKDDENE